MNLKREQNGITLIALIITIIVMLILVGVTISVALNGGLFTTTEQAVRETQKEVDKEQLLSAVIGAIGTDAKVDFSKLDSNLPKDWTGSNGTYTSPKGNTFKVSADGTITEGINFTAIKQDLISNPDKYLAKAAEAGQDTDSITDIAIGTDGNVVNLELWLYEIGGENIAGLSGATGEPGYLGSIVDGKIEGTMPQYIYSEGKIYEVMGLSSTFDGLAGLKYAPKLPETVIETYELFRCCEDLEVAPKLHEGITILMGMFEGCSSLNKVDANLIPTTAVDISYMFNDCVNLENAPVIPQHVKKISYIFADCTKLTGIITINTEYTGLSLYYSLFDGALKNVGSAERPIVLKGTGNNSAILERIKTTGNSAYITIEN